MTSAELRRNRIERMTEQIVREQGVPRAVALTTATRRDWYLHRYDASAGDCALRMFARGNGAVGFEPR